MRVIDEASEITPEAVVYVRARVRFKSHRTHEFRNAEQRWNADVTLT